MCEKEKILDSIKRGYEDVFDVLDYLHGDWSETDYMRVSGILSELEKEGKICVTMKDGFEELGGRG